ncbi:UNVERIFIED_CONTAM: hypothetical protein Sradi_1558100 [Sesamum radiatum]|uniref:DUF659 domain-containing protein n=1 Tax=Sesamum radiatum TaxID=300843 RepID=A0AAW2U9K0_SESRA
MGIKACPKVTVGQIVEMTKLEDEAVQRKERGQPKMVPLPRSICSSSQSSSHSVSMDAINSSSFRQERYEPKKRKVGSDSALEKAFNFQVREQLDSEIARMFYSGGLPFNLARNPYYVRAFSFAANNNIAGYVPPGYNSLRTKLLQKEKANVENLLEYTKSTWKTKVHTLNLALKNICAAKNTEANGITYEECHWITEIAASALMIRNFIMNHSMRLAMFNEFSKLKLLAVAETRFASVIVMLKRFKLIKQQLKMMVISEQWSCYRDDDITKARNVKEKLLDDSWWDSIDYILDFTEPIYEMLRATDTDKPCLHLVYDMWDNMISKVKETIYKHEKKAHYEESSFWGVVHKVLEDRWSKSNTPLHCLAHS